MKQNTQRRRILGIYYDKNNHPYFFQSKSRTAFFIPEEDLKLAEVVAYRHWIALSVAVVLLSFFPMDYYYPLAVGVLLFAALEWYYRQRMISKYKKISPFTPHLDKKDKEYNGQKKSIVLMKAVIYLVVSGLIIWTVIDQGNEGISLAILVAMAGVSFFSAIQNFVFLFKKRL